MSPSPWHLFERIGVELEYMIVDAETLDVKPVCDRLMERVAGEPVSEVERGDIAWSNELALHVLEFKTNGPVASLEGLATRFRAEIAHANRILGGEGARLLPTGMHPWMDPHRETRLWPHEYSPIYFLYDELFDCSGHGWSNLQSAHINLPFSGDEEFRRLHSAIRLVLPFLPIIASTTPFVEGHLTGYADNRLRYYANNQRRFPAITGRVIPDVIRSEEEYRACIHGPIRDAVAAHDPDGLLDPHFLNSRGAIARFDRGAIEVRVLDLQETPEQDIAVIEFAVEMVRALVEERWSSLDAQEQPGTESLAHALFQGIASGDFVVDETVSRGFGLRGARSARDLLGDVYDSLAAECYLARDEVLERLQTGGFTAWARESFGSHIPGSPEMQEALRSAYRSLAERLGA